MELDFLKQFSERMKSVGAYGVLFKNSIQKGTWRQYGFDSFYEQTNLIFAVLLYIMEQSLKDEPCTMDDIGSFIDTVNMRWFKKSMSYEMCKELGDFIINVILCDEGRVMYFEGFDFSRGEYKKIHISFVANKVVYLDSDVRRTSYYLTDNGYSLMLSTLEIESNMKLTIYEMIFKLHLEKATYDKAVDDIKNIFNQLHMQLQRMQEAMRKIRQNVLNYSVHDYKDILENNLNTISETKNKFLAYRNTIKERVKELEERDINIKKLEQDDRENLNNLKVIEKYLVRTIDEHQKILSVHFDLKALYTKELEDMSQMSLIKRFDLRSELYDKVLYNPEYLENMDIFLRPLFNQEADKIYNVNKALEFQRPIRDKKEDDEYEIMTFDQEEWNEEKNNRLKERMKKYKSCLNIILTYAYENNGITLKGLKEQTGMNFEVLIPTAEIFKEVVIELLRNKEIDIANLKQERREHLAESTMVFQLNEYILDLIEENKSWKTVKRIQTRKHEEGEPVIFEGIASDTGIIKQIKCSDIYIKME